MSEMLIELDEVKIRLKWPQDNGHPIVVVPLEAGAFLLIPTKMLANLDPGWLDEIRRKVSPARPEPEPWPEWARPTPQKERALRELRALGYSVSDGREYFRSLPPHTPTTLEEVHQALAGIRGSLSDDVIAERDER